MTRPDFRGVVFDLDGTLINSEPLWARVESSVAAADGIDWTEEDAFSYFGRPLAQTTQAIIDRGLDLTVDEAIDRMITELSSIYRSGVPWLPGAVDLLATLQANGTATALGTQSFRRLASIVRDAAPEGTLREMVTGDELHKGKPDPEVFLTASQRLGLRPEEIVIVEDSSTGVDAGVATGAPVLAVPPSDAVHSSYAGQNGVSTVRSLSQVNLDLLIRIHAGETVDLW